MTALSRRRLLLVWLAAAAAGVSGCGQKGPLYLPEESGEEDKKKEKERSSAFGGKTPARV